MKMALVVCVALLGCAEKPQDVPTCWEAMAHSYAAGCPHPDFTSGAPLPLERALDTCENYSAISPPECRPMLDEWIECLDMATPHSSCDCGTPQHEFVDCAERPASGATAPD